MIPMGRIPYILVVGLDCVGLFNAFPQGHGSWPPSSRAECDLKSNALHAVGARPQTLPDYRSIRDSSRKRRLHRKSSPMQSGSPSPIRGTPTCGRYAMTLRASYARSTRRWDNTMLHEWDDIPRSAFEAVSVSLLMVDSDSGRMPDA